MQVGPSSHPAAVTRSVSAVNVRLFRASLALVLAACSAPAARLQSLPESQRGSYRFLERVGGTQSEIIQGTVTIELDTVFIDMSPGPCSYEDRSIASTNISYRCAGVLVSFDRTNPLMRAYYSMSIIERVPVRVCVRYVTNSSGQQVCAQYGTDYEERRVQKSGLLRLQRQTG
jgi:hypothetical protein